MSNTASAILWPSAPAAPAHEVGNEPEWMFYTQVSVSGPSVSTTVHRSESLRGARASLTRDEAPAPTTTTRTPTSPRSGGRTTANGVRGR